MARRLSFSGYDGSKPVAIPDIEAPLRAEGQEHSLARVLEIVLDHAGLPLGYDAIMGLCGLAFRTPPWPDAPNPSVAEATAGVEALSEALSGCLCVHNADEASEDDLLDAVATAVDAGRLCGALGWGSEKDRWSVITGYDRGKQRLLGHCVLEAPRSKYEGWPPMLDLLVVLTSEPRPRGPEAIEQALRAGGERCDGEGPQRYQSWIAEFRLLENAPGAQHERAVELLADARAAAAGFAEGVAEREDVIPAAWLARAAEQWREAVLLLESRGIPHSREAVEALATADGREDWAGLLAMVQRLDGEAAGCLRRAYRVDYLPDEAPRW